MTTFFFVVYIVN
jgi:hypothetical protein